MQKWLSSQEAERIFELGKANLRDMKMKKEIKSKKEGRINLYLSKDLRGKFPVRKKSEQIIVVAENGDKFVSENKEEPEEETKKISDRSEELNYDTPKPEAERIWKIEQAREKRLSNMLNEGELIPVSQILEDFQRVYNICFRRQRQLIDSWSVKYGLSKDLAKVMLEEFNAELKAASEEVKEKATTKGL